MTRVDFFFNVENKPQKLADLAEKILAKGRQLYVYEPENQTAQLLDDFLWVASATSFIAHELNTNQNAPVLIATHAINLQHDDVMVNFAADVPVFFSRFLRVIEMVGLEEVDKIAARKRFKFYRDQGYEIKTLDTTGLALS